MRFKTSDCMDNRRGTDWRSLRFRIYILSARRAHVFDAGVNRIGGTVPAGLRQLDAVKVQWEREFLLWSRP